MTPVTEHWGMAIALDVDNRVARVYGSVRCRTIEKLIFTVMNYLLPDQGIVPFHCSANEGRGGDSALVLGQAGTGKTTLSTATRPDPLGAGNTSVLPMKSPTSGSDVPPADRPTKGRRT